jgi:proteasome lid subunit RPN8/RPN11
MTVLPERLAKTIHAEGEASYPNECCGFLLGALGENGARVVSKLIPVVNAREAGEQYHRFRIEPDDFMRAEREARAQHMDILGFYHSHPDHAARPSDYDRVNALPFYVYLIVSVDKGAAAILTGWELSGDRARFNPEEITTL